MTLIWAFGCGGSGGRGGRSGRSGRWSCCGREGSRPVAGIVGGIHRPASLLSSTTLFDLLKPS